MKKNKPVPTNSQLWSKAKAQAKKKFDKYPSAYANLWASKWYKERGGKWQMDEDLLSENVDFLIEAYKGGLRNWLKQKWVRIDSSGNIAGDCGTSKNNDNPDRCLPLKKAKSLTKSERKATQQKKKQASKTGQQFVDNTKKAKVRT